MHSVASNTGVRQIADFAVLTLLLLGGGFLGWFSGFELFRAILSVGAMSIAVAYVVARRNHESPQELARAVASPSWGPVAYVAIVVGVSLLINPLSKMWLGAFFLTLGFLAIIQSGAAAWQAPRPYAKLTTAVAAFGIFLSLCLSFFAFIVTFIGD